MIREELVLQARSKVAKFCAFKERSPFEIKEKLKKWELNDLETDQIIDFLKRENYINEERFANAFCNDKFEFNHWGRIKIRLMIAKYQLPQDVVDLALNKLDQDKYFDTVLKLAKSKWSQLKAGQNEYIKKQKTVKFLMGKGFEADHCWAAVNKLS